ncbi:protein asteroid homolog 1-like isoform X1 [Gadus chalcogrammus]|uniref:protein asteroid homolog 1-like isoform X1 n=1 Tax=Gadus chalcogrammus TaxID=1042646 RepID=UPI0024C40B72|nr:protein asteroid homolog 1-like isoform X1 [Gadus chalcogrammus]
MGVKGLSSLLEDNRRISPDIHFRDSKLVVDGNNLLYHLYFSSNLDQNHGGEYLAFQAEVKAFFKTLADCGIKPYVVMDGGSGTSDIKLDTLLDRARGKVQKTHDAALTGKKVNILPPVTKHVFRQTLNELNVPMVKCFGEADCQLAALAKEWCCPVLSTDSDFYIFDLPGGLLHLDHFRWRAETRRGIPCRQYTTSSFCSVFHINPQQLPVFASLAGNDYVNLRDVKWARYLPAGSPKMKFSAANLVGLLSWLGARTDRTTEDTLTAVMKLMPSMSQQAQTEARTMLKTAMLEYELPSSSLRGFFSEGTVPPLPAEMLSCVPDWVRAPLARGELSGDVLDLLVHRRNKLQTQVERSDLQSSNLTSKHIRQVWYGLLLGQGGGEVEEVDRDGLELASVKVQPLVQGAAQTLRLDSLPQADRAVRLQVCLETLGVEEETLEGVPAHLRLPVAVTRYWLRRASPEATLLKALLMVMVQGELTRLTGGTTGWQGDTNHISQPLDGVVAHSFNQWQACLKDASQLNLLLCKPLPEPHFAWLFQGRLVHRQIQKLQERGPLEHSADFTRLYRSLLGAVTQPDPGADGRAGGPEAQLRASMGHLRLNP